MHDRSARAARYLWILVPPLFVVISVETFVVRPDLPGHAIYNPFWWLGLLVVTVSILTLISGLWARRRRGLSLGRIFSSLDCWSPEARRFFPSRYSTLAPENSLTAYGVASTPNAFRLASIWWPVGFALATIYFVFISRRYMGKVKWTTRGSTKACHPLSPPQRTHPH